MKNEPKTDARWDPSTITTIIWWPPQMALVCLLFLCVVQHGTEARSLKGIDCCTLPELLLTAPMRWRNTLVVNTPGSLGREGRRKKRKHFGRLCRSRSRHVRDGVHGSNSVGSCWMDSICNQHSPKLLFTYVRSEKILMFNWLFLFQHSEFSHSGRLLCVVQGGAWPTAYAVLWECSTEKLSGGTEKNDYFDPLTYFCLNEMWGAENRKHRGSIQFKGTICWSITERTPPMSVSVLTSPVLQFLAKVELCFCTNTD